VQDCNAGFRDDWNDAELNKDRNREGSYLVKVGFRSGDQPKRSRPV